VWPPPLSYAEMRALARHELPGARYRRHLLWRYSLLWAKPAAAGRQDDRPRSVRTAAAATAERMAAQARILAFWRSNSSVVSTPRSRSSASLASWSAGPACDPAACCTELRNSCS
jgi:hypothetical protein